MYLIAAIYLLTFLFNMRQEFMGPAASGWSPVSIPIWPDFRVAHVRPGSAMDIAGLKEGDVVEAVDGHSLNGVPDWFIARANLEINRPVDLQVRRGEQHLQLQFVITKAYWQTLAKWRLLRGIAVYLLRLIPLVIAIVIAFRRPWQASARLAALMLAAAGVAEGYPSPGWAAALRHLPTLLALPICLTTASWLLASVAWLSFFAIFPRPWFTRKWRLVLALVPLAIFLPPLITSVIAMVRNPWALTTSWVPVLSAELPLSVQATVGVAPLLFFQHWPLFQLFSQQKFLALWVILTIVYLMNGMGMLAVNYRRVQDRNERRRTAGLFFALCVLALVVAHNFFVRNWSAWFGTTAPALFSPGMFGIEALLFQLTPFTLAYAVLKTPNQLAQHGEPQGNGTGARPQAAHSGRSSQG